MKLEPALFDAVLADPTADEPRLILADWLDEHGDAGWAELVRLQITIARGEPDAREVARARRRETVLRQRYERRIRALLPAIEGVTWGELDRGFVSAFRTETLPAFFDHADAIRRAAPVHTFELCPLFSTEAPTVVTPVPWLTTLRLVGTEYTAGYDDLREPDLAALRALVTQVPRLELQYTDHYEDHGARMLEGLSLPHLEELVTLGEHTEGLAFARLVATSGAPLRTLRLGTDFVDYNSGYFEDPTLGDAGAAAIARAASLVSLEDLDLAQQAVGSEGLGALLQQLPRLQSLSLGHSELHGLPDAGPGVPFRRLRFVSAQLDDSVFDLLEAPRSAGLRELSLRENPGVSADGVARLVRAPAWSTLRILDLSHTSLVGLGAVLQRAPAPASLHTLLLWGAGLSPDDVDALIGLPWFRQLDHVDLSGAQGAALSELGEASIAVLTLARMELDADQLRRAHPALRRCEVLDISHNPVADGVGALLDDAPSLTSLVLREVPSLQWRATWGVGAPQLTRLDLRGVTLGDEGVEALLSGPLADRLLDLNLSTCRLTNRSIERLAAWPGLPRLHRLMLDGNRDIDEEGLLMLADALPAPPPVLTVSGTPWRYSNEVRNRLHERLGPDWNRGW